MQEGSRPNMTCSLFFISKYGQKTYGQKESNGLKVTSETDRRVLQTPISSDPQSAAKG
jgi:hypothetical protein